jgi:hypothetical protein
VPTAATSDVPPSAADGGWTPRPWREESRRTDLRQVGRFAHERVLRRPELALSPGAHHVASVLASYGDEHGRNIFPSQQTLARVCRRSVRHVRAKLRELTELGLVRRLSHGGGRPSHRDGRTRRVTPARYELTLPLSMIDDTGPAHDDGDRRGRPEPGRRDETTRGDAPQKQSVTRKGRQRQLKLAELSPRVVEQIRSVLGVAALSDRQAEAAIAAAVARAPGAVNDRIAYAVAVIGSDPAAFRPTPDVTEPPCPVHGQRRATRCPECAAARSDPPPAWTKMRAALRNARGP